MASKARSSEGCWTCRLRRKKCDEGRPECAGCAALEIDCLYSDTKPEWMDGGDRQKDKAEEVKAEVKRKAGWRRERRYMQSLESSLHDLEMTDGPDGTHLSTGTHRSAPGAAPGTAPSQTPSAQHNERQQAGSHDPSPSSQSSTQPEGIATPSADGRSETGSAHDGPSSSRSGFTPSSSSMTQDTSPGSMPGLNDTWMDTPPSTLEVTQTQPDSEREMSLVMVYLDFVFPFFFPFYRPPLTSGGRGWLLVLLMKNKALYHAALSLASYTFSNWLGKLDGLKHESCKNHAWAELQNQQELSVKQLMADIADINERGVKGRLREGTRVLASIIQILCFEVAIGNTGSWNLHLDGAVVLLDHIMWNNAATAPGNIPCWRSIMAQLAGDQEAPPHIGQLRPMNAHQAALSFFAAVLIYFDIVSSTALEAPPRLQRYHLGLLRSPMEMVAMQPEGVFAAALASDVDFSRELDIDPDTPPLDLMHVSGSQNWALIAVGEVAALDAWKKEQRSLGKLSMPELVQRAAQIENCLRSRLAALEAAEAAAKAAQAGPSIRPEALLAASLYASPPMAGPVPPPHVESGYVTRIWATTALSYLLVVVSGWQPASREIRGSVDATLDMLTKLPTPACLRTVSWPFAVTGCLASVEQEEPLRGMVKAIGELEVHGTIREASAIMEAVWARRGEIERGESGEWDIGRCLSLTGRRAFLV